MGIARSGVGWFLAKVGALGASWLAAMYFTRALADPALALGQFYVFETIVSFLMLVTNGGINSGMGKRISEGQDVPQFVGAGVLLSGILTVAATILVVLVSPLIVDVFGGQYLPLLFVIGLVWALQVRNTATAILDGLSNVGRSGGIGLLDTATRVGFQAVLVHLGFEVIGLMAGALAGTGIAASIAVVILGVGLERPRLEHVRGIVRYAKYSILYGFTTKFYDNIDIIVITGFLGAAATGIYGIGFRFSLILTIFSGAISTSSLPEISRHSVEGNDERVREIFTDAVIFSTLLSVPALAGMIVIADPLIITFYTEAFSDAALVATIAVAVQIPDAFRSVFNSTINAIDRPDLAMRSGILLIVTNAVLDVILVPTVGIVGAVVASLVGITLASGYSGYVLLKALDISWRVLPFRQLGAEVAAAGLMAVLVYEMKSLVSFDPVVELTFLIGMGVVLYFSILLTISPGIRDRILGITRDVVPERVYRLFYE